MDTLNCSCAASQGAREYRNCHQLCELARIFRLQIRHKYVYANWKGFQVSGVRKCSQLAVPPSTYIVHNSMVRGNSQHVKTIVDRSKSSNQLPNNTKSLRSTIFAFIMDESSQL